MSSVLSDCLLDFTASLVVPIALSFNYDSAISQETRSVSMRYMYDDELLITVTSEYQLVMGSSWIDILNRSVLILSLLAGMQTAKQLLETAPEQGIHPAMNTAPPQTILIVDARIEASTRLRSWQSRLVRLPWIQLFHALLVVWDFILATLHLRAKVRSVNHSSCPIVLRPWLGTNEIPCPLLIMDYNQAGISGFESEIQTLWEPIELTQVLRLVFRHCPSLEIPAAIDRFTRIKSLKVYNNTIVWWEDSVSALSSNSHPLLRYLQFLRTDLLDQNSRLVSGALGSLSESR